MERVLKECPICGHKISCKESTWLINPMAFCWGEEAYHVINIAHAKRTDKMLKHWDLKYWHEMTRME